jgi:pilus assembly protein Flp/PilA
MFSRQPTEETIVGKKPGGNPGQTARRRMEKMLTKFFVKMQNKMQDMMKAEEGQGLVEYALIIVLIAIVLIGALVYLEGGINVAFSKASSAVRRG